MTELTDFLLARFADDYLFWETVGKWSQAHPERVKRYQADAEAKRRIVALHEPDSYQDGRYCGHCDQKVPCPDLRILAGIYADHTDYRAEWGGGMRK